MAEHAELLSPDLWERVAKRIELYAFRIVGRRTRPGRTGPIEYMIGEGADPIDLAQETLYKFLKGEIRPDPSKPLTESYLVNLLKGALKKDYFDLLKKIEDHVTDFAIEVSERPNNKQSDADFFDSYKLEKTYGFKRHQILSDPMTQPNEYEQIQETEKSLRALYEEVRDEEPLREVISAVCEGECENPREIAAYIKTSRKDIYNRLKKLRRRFHYLLPVRQRRKKAI